MSAAVLWWVGRRVDWAALSVALEHVQWPWLAAAFAALALSLIAGAWRWHQMLRLSNMAVSFAVSLRLTLIGHAFSALLFGAAVSDVAKATLYSRWFGHPVPSLLAASALDRSAAVISTTLYGLATVLCAVAYPPDLGGVQIALPPLGTWLRIAAVGIPCLAAAVWMSRRRWSPYLAVFMVELGKAASTLRRRPKLTTLAIASGLWVQLMISLVLAFSLRALFPGQLPWLQMLWTFPAIGVVASLPVTLSGAGAREGAACLLWAGFGISNTLAFGAGLLTLSVNLFWALTGLVMMALEFQKRRQPAP